MGFFLEKMFNYKIVKYSLLQESYVIQHKKVEKYLERKGKMHELCNRKRGNGARPGELLPSSLKELKKQV